MIALATVIALSLAQQRVSGATIAALAAHEVDTALHQSADERIVRSGSVPDQLVAAGRLTMHAGQPLGTPFYYNVPVTLAVDGQTQRTIYVGYRVERYVETAVAARDLLEGDVLAADDLRMARVPYTGMPPNGIDVLVGRRLADPVMHGQPVRIGETAINQIVKPGDTVVMIVHDGAVQVSSDAIARTGGGLGQDVSVYNPYTHKALSGTVTAAGTVELDISGGDE